AAHELALARGHDRHLATQLLHRHLEREPGPRRWLLEDHRQHLAFERLRVVEAAFIGEAAIEHAAQLCRVDAVEIEEVPGRRHCVRQCGHCRATPSMMPTASPIWPSSIMSGGSSRTTFSPAPTVRRPAWRSFSTISPLGTTHLIPLRRPLPRRSARTLGCLRTSPSSCRARSAAIFSTWGKKPSASITSSTALAIAMASGLPPKVEPCVPGFM